MGQTVVTYTLEDRIAALRMDDGKVNAISPALLQALDAALTQAEQEAQAVLLLGRPGCFSAGFDLKVLGQGGEPARQLARAGAELLLRLMRLPIPVVAGCTGHALALGALILLASDHRIGARGSFKLGLNEVAIGLPLPRFAVELAKERLEPRQRLRVALCADVCDPERAVRAGFLDELVSAESLESEARVGAARLAALPGPGFEATKRRLRDEWAERASAGLEEDIEELGG